MDNLIAYIKKRLCYETSWAWSFLLGVLYSWKFFFYGLMPILVVWAASNSYIAVSNQLELGAQLDRIEEAQETQSCSDMLDKYIDEWIGHPPRKNIEVKWVWSCNWSIHDKDWDFDDGAFGESVSGCGAGNQPWKEHNWVWTRDQAYVLRNKHNEETGHTAWVGKNLTLTPSK